MKYYLLDKSVTLFNCTWNFFKKDNKLPERVPFLYHFEIKSRLGRLLCTCHSGTRDCDKFGVRVLVRELTAPRAYIIPKWSWREKRLYCFEESKWAIVFKRLKEENGASIKNTRS